LFLREGNLWRHNLADGAELQLATAVHAFAASPDGRWLAVVRIVEERADLWLLRPDGTELRRLTDDARAEGSLVWSPAGDQLLYATAAAAPLPHTPDWFTWTAWCRASEVRALALEGGEPLSLGLGCDPAISADGKRIAFATPPQRLDPSMSGASAGIVNSVRLVNRQGGNGWDFTTAPGTGVGGLLVYAPSWSPDSQQLAFQRFVGYQALTDLNYTEVAGSFQGGGELAGVGAGWLFAPRYSSDGRFLLISEHNYSNAAGASGYQAWSLRLLDLAKPDSIALPEGTRGTVASELVRLNQAQQALWLPGEAAAAVLLPVGWSASQAPLAGGAAVPGEVRRWTSEGGVGELLVNEVDFASPLGWLR
jgi:Tol biopolymer transport system component